MTQTSQGSAASRTVGPLLSRSRDRADLTNNEGTAGVALAEASAIPTLHESLLSLLAMLFAGASVLILGRRVS